MKKFGPCKILKKFDSCSAYEVELPNDMDISPIFNIDDFYKYHELDDEFIVSDDNLRSKLKRLNKYWIKELVREQEKNISMSIW